MSRTTRERLTRIPDLAAEVFVTWGHPNPSGHAERGRNSPGSKAPTDLAVLDALRPGERGMLAGLTECVRIVWQAMDAGERPDLTNPPNWASECGWLLRSWDWAQASLDLSEIDWISDTIRRTHATLSELAREARPLVLHCTRMVGTEACGGGLIGRDERNADTGDWTASRWAYCAECGQTYTYTADLRRLGSVRDWTLVECAAEVGVSVLTLKRWKKAGRITATGKNWRGVSVFDLEAVRRAKSIGA